MLLDDLLAAAAAAEVLGMPVGLEVLIGGAGVLLDGVEGPADSPGFLKDEVREAG